MDIPLIKDEEDPKWALLGGTTCYYQIKGSKAGDGKARDSTGERGRRDA
jgi:hypothetical protein